ncbi:MAG: lipase maturation factor family protein, partial [Myxococcota bacterium]
AWFVHLVAKLLEADPETRRLLARGPFETTPPRAIRARTYEYRFTRRGGLRDWWERRLVSEYLPPLVRDDPRLVEALRRRGWH